VKKRFVPSSKKTHARRERARAIAAHPERYKEDDRKWFEAHKHLLGQDTESKKEP
jgi:hypothetical protein